MTYYQVVTNPIRLFSQENGRSLCILSNRRILYSICLKIKQLKIIKIMKKKIYENPESELITVRIEENFLNSIESKSIQTLEYDDDELNC